MINNFLLVIFTLFLTGPNIKAQFSLQEAFPNLEFNNPVFLTHADDSIDRIFIVEQPGIIQVFPNNSNALLTKEYLNITDRVSSGGEKGLLGLAFHPNYETNGYFYVNYTADNPLRTIISRFQVTSNPDSANKNSEFQLLTFNQPYSNHNGGWIGFGPNDGYLYIATGDGGSGGDPQNYAQRINTLLGKILCIDVDGGTPYAIPPTNPFFDSTNVNVRKEIYAWGLRNPWRCSFDYVTGWLWAGDVGQGSWEEINIIENGKNYGWRCYEGNHNHNMSGCNYPEYIFPIWEYSSSSGNECSITGGYVYRGLNVPELEGKYIYGDYCSNKIWALTYDGINPPTNQLLLTASGGLTSFGVDQNQELYLTSFNGNIYRFTPITTPVELSSFSSIILENGINLKWRTETEVSNYGFDILRSVQNDIWEKIGFVEGHGNSNSPKDYSFIDENVSSGKYSYRLKQIDTDGKFEYSKIIEVEFNSPIQYGLSQNYPNPFNPATIIKYSLPEDSNISIRIYDAIGKEVDLITTGIQTKGSYQKIWNAKGFASGVYYVKMDAKSLSSDKTFSKVIKMLYLK
jgi:glucose/arabinose dehydrogenase